MTGLVYLERQLQLTAGDHNVGEIQQVHLQGVQHTLPGHDDALGLLLNWQRPDQSRHLQSHESSHALILERGLQSEWG